eukprot:TRINITY_DN10360_c0_g2_i1.p1 TRINITY_DN10360_c0_g2~~TRINITY_DN10360_c0_g2_i1.p1  ORF type:complete len:361 (+),score=52.76 TRINITY_DN10360_c0_g2_i1:105-1085(+)
MAARIFNRSGNQAPDTPGFRIIAVLLRVAVLSHGYYIDLSKPSNSFAQLRSLDVDKPAAELSKLEQACLALPACLNDLVLSKVHAVRMSYSEAQYDISTSSSVYTSTAVNSGHRAAPPGAENLSSHPPRDAPSIATVEDQFTNTSAPTKFGAADFTSSAIKDIDNHTTAEPSYDTNDASVSALPFRDATGVNQAPQPYPHPPAYPHQDHEHQPSHACHWSSVSLPGGASAAGLLAFEHLPPPVSSHHQATYQHFAPSDIDQLLADERLQEPIDIAHPITDSHQVGELAQGISLVRKIETCPVAPDMLASLPPIDPSCFASLPKYDD